MLAHTLLPRHYARERASTRARCCCLTALTYTQQRQTNSINPSTTAPKMPSKVLFEKLSKAQQNRVVQKQARRVKRDERDRARFPNDATRKGSLYKEYRHNKKRASKTQKAARRSRDTRGREELLGPVLSCC
jgi:hypothetical protein